MMYRFPLVSYTGRSRFVYVFVSLNCSPCFAKISSPHVAKVQLKRRTTHKSMPITKMTPKNARKCSSNNKKVLQCVMLSQSQAKPPIHAEKVIPADFPLALQTRSVPLRVFLVASLRLHGAWSSFWAVAGKGRQSRTLARPAVSSSRPSHPRMAMSAGTGYEVAAWESSA